MNSVVSYDKFHDEVDLIENDSNFFKKRLNINLNGTITLKQVLWGVFAVLLIGVVILVRLMNSNEKSSSTSYQIDNSSLLNETSTSTTTSFVSTLSPSFAFTPEFVSPTVPTSISPSTQNELKEKLQFVREMMLDSWKAYERYAWGDEELMPVSRKAYNGGFGAKSGMTLVTSMSTLWTMELKDEFENGKKWIESELDLKQLDKTVRVYDVILNYVGGLLSCYALTGDRMFLDKANEIGQLLEPSFNSQSGKPYRHINFKHNALVSYEIPAYPSGIQLDFNYLSDASGDAKFRNHIARIQKARNESTKTKNHYFNWIVDKYVGGSLSSLCTDSCELFSSLIKSYIQSNHRDVQSLQMYSEALDAIRDAKMFQTFPNGLYHVRGYDNSSKTHDTFMRYSSCYVGAMLSMGSKAKHLSWKQSIPHGKRLDKEAHKKNLEKISTTLLGELITETCQRASSESATGLGPHKFYYNNVTQHAIAYERFYYLSPELAESNFILWRLTHKPKYRENAWQMAQAIHKHCRVESGGYSGVYDVDELPTHKNDYQSPIFLSATLKYLYLTFTDDTVLPLDQFVFNSVGHPLPICGNNTMYPADICKF